MKAGRASATSRLIAAAVIRAALDGVCPPPTPQATEYSRCFLGGSRPDRLLRASVENQITRAAWRALERLVAPGIVQHFMRRKAWIERTCRTALADGFSQVLVLGAGLDTLGVRLTAANAALRVVEVDHPATQAIKVAALGPQKPEGIRLVHGDLGSVGLEDVLQRTMLDHLRPTVVVVEGLVMYLTEARTRQLLAEVARLPLPRVRLVLTFMDEVRGHPVGFRPRNRLVDAWLRSCGEPFQWGWNMHAAAQAFVQAGFRPPELVDERRLAREWPGRILDGEILAVSDRR